MKNLLLDDEENFMHSSIRENQNNHLYMTQKMIHLLVKWLYKFLQRNERTISIQILSSLEKFMVL